MIQFDFARSAEIKITRYSACKPVEYNEPKWLITVVQ